MVKTRQRTANVFSKFYEDLNEGERDCTGGDVMMEIEGEDKELEQKESIKEFTTEEIQSAIDRLKKGRRKTAMEYELNN